MSPTSPASLRTLRGRAALAAAVLLTLVVLIGAQRVIGWSTVARLAGSVPAWAWSGFAVCMTGSYFARVCRLWALLRQIGRGVRLREAASMFLVHNTLVTFVPARLGEAALPILAHRWAALDWRPVVGALAWWRLSDLTIVAALALALIALGATALRPLFIVAALACALPFIAFGLRQWLLRENRAPGGDPSSLSGVTALARRVVRGMPGAWASLARDLALGSASWMLKIAGLTLLIAPAVMSGLPVQSAPLGWPLLAASVLAGDAAGALPLPSLGSIGPYEAGVVSGLAASGLALEPAFAAALLVHAALLASVLAGGAVGIGLRLTRPPGDASPDPR